MGGSMDLGKLILPTQKLFVAKTILAKVRDGVGKGRKTVKELSKERIGWKERGKDCVGREWGGRRCTNKF